MDKISFDSSGKHDPEFEFKDGLFRYREYGHNWSAWMVAPRGGGIARAELDAALGPITTSITNIVTSITNLTNIVAALPTEQSIRVQATSSQVMTAGGGINVVAYDTTNHLVGTSLAFSNANDWVTVATAGRYHLAAALRLNTPLLGLISNTAFILQVDQGSTGTWLSVAEWRETASVKADNDFTVNCGTDFQIVANSRVRCVVQYNSTLSAVLTAVFPASGDPINSLSVSRIN